MSLKNGGQGQVLFVTAPSGGGKSDIIEMLRKQGYIFLRSEIELKPPKIICENGIYKLIGRLPRAKNPDTSVWHGGLDDPSKVNLQIPEERSKIELNLSQYVTEMVEWEYVSTTDKTMYNWLTPNEFNEKFSHPGTAELDVIGTRRGYDFRPISESGKKYVIEADANSLFLYCQALEQIGIEFKIANFWITDRMCRGQMQYFRNEPKGIIAERSQNNKNNQNDLLNPLSQAGELSARLQSEGLWLNLVTTENTYKGEGELNRQSYRFIETSNQLSIVKLDGDQYVNTAEVHVKRILDFCNNIEPISDITEIPASVYTQELHAFENYTQPFYIALCQLFNTMIETLQIREELREKKKNLKVY